MSDRRLHPDATHVQTSIPGQIKEPLVDLLAAPKGPRDRQLVLGEAVTTIGTCQNFNYVKAAKDGYIGWVRAHAIGPPSTPTHQVTAAATHAYAEASIKSFNRVTLTFGARLTAHSDNNDFIETSLGHVPKTALSDYPAEPQDPVTTARLFLNTPYLWGGNSRSGIDCSGLIQAVMIAAALACPGDSDQQEHALGGDVTDQSYQTGDLLFWQGHVAMITSATTMIHANAFHMNVTEELIGPAINRIALTGGGPVTSHKRL